MPAAPFTSRRTSDTDPSSRFSSRRSRSSQRHRQQSLAEDRDGGGELRQLREGREKVSVANLRSGGPRGKGGEHNEVGPHEKAGTLQPGNAVAEGESGMLVTDKRFARSGQVTAGHPISVKEEVGADARFRH